MLRSSSRPGLELMGFGLSTDRVDGPSEVKQLESLARRDEGACCWQATDEQRRQ